MTVNFAEGGSENRGKGGEREREKRDSRKEDMRLIYCVITGANSASRTFEFCFHTHILCHIFDYCLAMYVVLQI